MKKINHRVVLSSAVMASLLLGLYIYKPVSFGEMSTVSGFVKYARSFGVLMPIASFVIAAFQAIVPAIPFVILCVANGVMFGIAGGIILTWLGTLTGATILFYVSRRLGYEWAEKRYHQANLNKLKNLDGYHGFLVILGLRLLPYFPASLINIMAGVSRINFWWFFFASAIGKLPFLIGYTVLGYNLLYTKNYTLGVIVMIALIAIPYLIVRTTRKRPTFKEREP